MITSRVIFYYAQILEALHVNILFAGEKFLKGLLTRRIAAREVKVVSADPGFYSKSRKPDP